MATQCPLCKHNFPNGFKFRLLNSVPVCKACRSEFATRRRIAFVIDYAIFYVISHLIINFWFVNSTVQQVSLIRRPGSSLKLQFSSSDLFLTFVVPSLVWFLYLLKDGFHGISPGKCLLGLRVVDTTTRQPISFGQSFKRNLVLMIPGISFAIAFALDKGTRWGDGSANTVVIWKKHLHHPVFDPRGFLCTCCGYDLTGNVTGRCPECFTPTGVPMDDTQIPEAIPVARAIS